MRINPPPDLAGVTPPVGLSSQRGFAFLPFLLANWQLIAIGLLVLSVFAYYKHCEQVKTRHDVLIASLKAAAIENEKKVQAAIEKSRKDKERADDENKRTIASLRTSIKRLRDARPSTFLSAAPSGSVCPQGQVCFDKPEFERAYGKLVAELRGIADEGSEIAVDLQTAQRWAKDQ